MKKQSNVIFDDKDFPVSITRRTIFTGTGVDMEEVAQKPLSAIVNSKTDINPGHMHLDKLADRARDGIHTGGGVPFEFNVPAPCDGITMGHDGMRYVLAQRELIADIVETHIRSMKYDAMVMIASCDKIIPGMLMAAARLDIPTTGFPVAATNPLIVDKPILKLVKDPGPSPTANPSKSFKGVFAFFKTLLMFGIIAESRDLLTAISLCEMIFSPLETAKIKIFEEVSTDKSFIIIHYFSVA